MKARRDLFKLIILIFVLACWLFFRPRPNIIIVVLDAVRPDHLSCYGYARETSPKIDRLAVEGCRFLNAYSAASWTCESVASIMTGVNPLRHKVWNWGQHMNPEFLTLSEILGQAGYRTLFASSSAGLKCMDFHRGFQEVYWATDDEDPSRQEECMQRYLSEWFVAKKSSRPFFIYLHFHAAHGPFRLPQESRVRFLHDGLASGPKLPIGPHQGQDYYQKRGYGNIPYEIAEDGITDLGYYIAQYDSSIYYTDNIIGDLVRILRELRIYNNTLIIVTADHGEMLGEHGIYLKHGEPYEECRRVPLIVKLPFKWPWAAGKLSSRQVSLLDVAPTVLGYARIKPPFYMEGKSLFAGPFSRDSGEREFLYTHVGSFLALVSGRWKLVNYTDPYTLGLYDLKNDPQEARDLAGQEKETLSSMKKKLEKFTSNAHWDPADAALVIAEVGEEHKKQLRSLGYLQ